MQMNRTQTQNSFSACKSFWTCCSDTNPCKINEGDCDSDNDCIGNLRCGVANCGSMYPINSDCCQKKGKHIVIRNDWSLKLWHLKLTKRAVLKRGAPFQIYNHTKKRVLSSQNDDQSFFLPSPLLMYYKKSLLDTAFFHQFCLASTCLHCFTGPNYRIALLIHI